MGREALKLSRGMVGTAHPTGQNGRNLANMDKCAICVPRWTNFYYSGGWLDLEGVAGKDSAGELYAGVCSYLDGGVAGCPLGDGLLLAAGACEGAGCEGVGVLWALS